MKRVITVLMVMCLVFTSAFMLGNESTFAASKPKKVVVKSIKTSDTWAVMKWKKTAHATGYEVYAKGPTDPDFIMIADVRKKPDKKGYINYTYKKLVKDTPYVFKVRAYKKIKKKKVYGKYSLPIEKRTKDPEKIRQNVYNELKKYITNRSRKHREDNWQFMWRFHDGLNDVAQRSANSDVYRTIANKEAETAVELFLEDYFGNGTDVIKVIKKQAYREALLDMYTGSYYEPDTTFDYLRTFGVGYGHNGLLVILVSQDDNPVYAEREENQ